jgi:hypothetical protein
VMRSGGYKFIAAPRPEMFQTSSDPGETRNLAESDRARATTLGERVDRISLAQLPKTVRDPESAARLNALGYTSGGRPAAGGSRADPKDKRELAMRLAQVTSGELSGAALRSALERILADDPANPQAHVRMGYLLLEARQCSGAERHFKAAIAGELPGGDALLGLASCQAAARQFAAASQTLEQAERAEPGNPVVVANRGIVLSDAGKPADAIPWPSPAFAPAGGRMPHAKRPSSCAGSPRARRSAPKSSGCSPRRGEAGRIPRPITRPSVHPNPMLGRTASKSLDLPLARDSSHTKTGPKSRATALPGR